jgi:hypothetical protein
VLVRPGRFFDNGVAPGDQAPGLTFAMAVAFVAELSRVLLVADAYPVFGGQAVLSALLWLGLAVLLVTPLLLHLSAAAATVVLLVVTDERAGVSETVQALAYAVAPCALAGIPVVELRALAVVYAAYLLVVGLRVVHGTTTARAALVASVPAVLGLGLGFRGAHSIGVLLRQWYLI